MERYIVDSQTGEMVLDKDLDAGFPRVSFSVAELNRTPLSLGPLQVEYVKHPGAPKGVLRVDRRTGMILKTMDGELPLPNFPQRLPVELARRPQPNVHGCSRPAPGNLGCWAAPGCPVLLKYELAGLPPPQPHNVIIHRDGHYDSHPCFNTYVGVTPAGRLAHQVAVLAQGWELVTDRTTIVQNVLRDGVEREEEIEVPDLGPEYDEIKRKKEAERAAAEEQPKEDGTPLEGDAGVASETEAAAPKPKRKYRRKKRWRKSKAKAESKPEGLEGAA